MSKVVFKGLPIFVETVTVTFEKLILKNHFYGNWNVSSCPTFRARSSKPFLVKKLVEFSSFFWKLWSVLTRSLVNFSQFVSVLVDFEHVIQDKNAWISYRQEGGAKQPPKFPHEFLRICIGDENWTQTFFLKLFGHPGLSQQNPGMSHQKVWFLWVSKVYVLDSRMRLFFLQLRSFCLWFVFFTYCGWTVSKTDQNQFPDRGGP